MNRALVIRGRYAGRAFIPEEPLPDAEGTAELIVFPQQQGPRRPESRSIFELFGKADRLRSAEDIDAQIKEERDSWGPA